MPRKVRQLRADMHKAGCVWRPGKGSHQVWEHPLLPEEEVSLSGNDGDDAKPYQEKRVRVFLAKLRDVQRRKP